MAVKKLTENPTISDTLDIEISTTDLNDLVADPVRVDRITIYYIERSFVNLNLKEYDKTIDTDISTFYYKDAVPVKQFGTDADPAWLDPVAFPSSNPENNIITRTDDGEFEFTWIPEFAKGGDYFICWIWTPILAGDKKSSFLHFYLEGDTQVTTSIPTHFTTPGKYDTLQERYLPEMFKLKITDSDLTPDVLDRFNKALSGGFTVLEDLANQVIDLMDANATHESFLPLLGNLFKLKLRSQDPTLWRRQIKKAVPLFKRKGTKAGLSEALSTAGIMLNSVSQMWQVISSSTWQESFTVTEAQAESPDPIVFTLSKTAVISPWDALNFELYHLPAPVVGLSHPMEQSIPFPEFTSKPPVSNTGFATALATGATAIPEPELGDCVAIDTDDGWQALQLNYIIFADTGGGITTATWNESPGGALPTISLSEGDMVRIVYKISNPSDQNLEYYIRSLPLADNRIAETVTYPPKNWNVRLIEETDGCFELICPMRHPFNPPLVYGQIRTEFPYSENIYNMEEYNGSIRDSTDPCDLGKEFLDSCGCCISSKLVVTVEIEDFSNDRLIEAQDIVKEFIPFHAQLHSLNVCGGISEFVPPPIEYLEIIITMQVSDIAINGQTAFHRIMALTDPNIVKRETLASLTSVVPITTGTGKNDAIVIYSPNVRFDLLGLNASNNLLEILSGPDAGNYTASEATKTSVKINEGVSIGFPLDTSEFAYNLSNEIFSGTVNIFQDNKFVFTDTNVKFRLLNVQTVQDGTPWKIEVTAGPNIGTYTIENSFPDGSIEINGWTGAAQSSVVYDLKTDGDVVVDSSTTGDLAIENRAKVEAGSTLDGLVRVGDYVRYSGTQYRIIDFVDSTKVFIKNYTAGDVGGASIEIYRRLLDGRTGFLDVRGMTLETTSNHETGLGIVNGSNPPVGEILENNSFMENFLILIGTDYYRMSGIDGTTITLTGPSIDWGLSGTPVNYSINKLENTSPVTINDHEFIRYDRRGRNVIEIDIESSSPMWGSSALAAEMLNAANKGEILNKVSQNESIWIEIEEKNE